MVMLASFNELRIGKSLAAQWLGLSDFTAETQDSISGQGINPTNHTVQPKRKRKKNGISGVISQGASKWDELELQDQHVVFLEMDENPVAFMGV